MENIYKSEDLNLNDFLYCCEQFKERPSKFVMTSGFKATDFINQFSIKDSSIVNSNIEFKSNYSETIINDKVLAKLTNDIYCSYMQINKKSPNSYINNIIFYYKAGYEKIEYNITELQNLNKREEPVHQQQNEIKLYFTPIVINSSVEIDAMELFENRNMGKYINDSTFKSIKKLIKNIDIEEKGLSIIYGKRGTGKTNILNYIANKSIKEKIFIPISMIDHTINNPQFKNLLEEFSEDTLIIIDDCEVLFDDMFMKSNITTANILQMIDGFYADNINVNIILSFNIETEEELDEDLINCNNLIDIIKVGPLKKSKAKDLCEYLSIDGKVNNDIYLIDIMKNKFDEKNLLLGYQ